MAHRVPASLCYVFIDWNSKAIAEPVQYRGENVDTLLRTLNDDDAHLRRKFCVPTHMTADDERVFLTSTHCHLCKKPVVTDENKVHNHCHMTGTYLGAAHNECNLNCRIPKTRA